MCSLTREISVCSLLVIQASLSLVCFSYWLNCCFTGLTCLLTYFFVAHPEAANVAMTIAANETKIFPDLIMYPPCGPATQSQLGQNGAANSRRRISSDGRERAGR